MCLLLPLLSIRNAIVRENKLGWNGIGWEGSRLCHQFDGTAPAVSVILPVSVVGLFVFGAHAFTVPSCTRLLAGHVTLTCGHHLLALIFGLMIGVGRACRPSHLSVLVLRQEISRKRRRTDRFFVSLVFARGFHMIFQHMCWSSHVCTSRPTSHVETMLDGEERMHT